MNAKLKQILLLIDKTNTLDLKLWSIIAGICKSGNILANERLRELGSHTSQIQKIMTCNYCAISFKHILPSYSVSNFYVENSLNIYLCNKCHLEKYKKCASCELYFVIYPKVINIVEQFYCCKCSF